MANFLFCRYHFVPAEEPDLFAQEDRTDASRDLYEFKTDKAGVQTSVQYENDVINSFGGVTMLQVRNNKHKRVIPIDRLEELDVPHYPYTLVIDYFSRELQPVEILLARGARTILWGGAVSPREHLLESCHLHLDY